MVSSDTGISSDGVLIVGHETGLRGVRFRRRRPPSGKAEKPVFPGLGSK